MPNRMHIHIAKAHQTEMGRRAEARRRTGPDPARPPDARDAGAGREPAGRATAIAAVRRAQRKLARQPAA